MTIDEKIANNIKLTDEECLGLSNAQKRELGKKNQERIFRRIRQLDKQLDSMPSYRAPFFIKVKCFFISFLKRFFTAVAFIPAVLIFLIILWVKEINRVADAIEAWLKIE